MPTKKVRTIQELSKKIQTVFEGNFGQTPLRQRNEDILGEAVELSRFTTIPNLKEEHGDLLCSLLQSFNENGWDPTECAEATLAKIERRAKQYRAYGRKLSVAILGGAFDPITQGHVAVAEFLLNFSSVFDQVFIMPCFSHIHNKKMTSPEHRLEMCRLATKHDRRIKIFDYEIQNKLGGETYHLVKKLMGEDFSKNQYDFSFVIGGDNAASFDRWVNYKDLERMIRFVVVPRTGVALSSKNAWYLKPPHMLLVPESPLPEISSTDIRSSLKSLEGIKRPNGVAKDFLDKNLNPEVYSYILKHKLYK